MNKDVRRQCINAAHEGMELGQTVMDHAESERERTFGSALYNAFYSIYWLMVDEDRKERRYLMRQAESREGGLGNADHIRRV